ncbi:hypothetical protein [Yinghuangia soli]|uniref:Uncharacterized protein n=1 Tax=Yinghuangia soli TaxID=2908204 RepID=A0AA41Q707_9ACTN|nr:hypothetical protein [Yinghuangia soli]MCF2531534.1 hypothetical protein [Yinghuangia soli]
MKAGAEVAVAGEGWPVRTHVRIMLCGQGPSRVRGTADCAAAGAVTAYADHEGRFRSRLVATAPPVPCPCVVRAYTPMVSGADAAEASVPVVLSTHPVTGGPPPPGDSRYVLSMSELSGKDGLLTAFGAPARRTVRLRLGNAGNASAAASTIQVSVGRDGADPDWQDRARTGPIAPGSSTEIAFRVELPSAASGRWVVTVALVDATGVREPITAWPVDLESPWGLTVFRILLWGVPALVLLRILVALGRTRATRGTPVCGNPDPRSSP